MINYLQNNLKDVELENTELETTLSADALYYTSHTHRLRRIKIESIYKKTSLNYIKHFQNKFCHSNDVRTNECNM